MRTTWIILMILFLPCWAIGQCESVGKKPKWIDESIDNSNYSYYIETETGAGATREEAQNKAVQSLYNRRSDATGKRVNVKMLEDGTVAIAGSDELTAKIWVRDTYVERCDGQYQVTVLAQILKIPDPNYTFDPPLSVTAAYSFSELKARPFIPGMAQLYKGSTAKGIAFIAGEVLLVGGIVACEGLRASSESKINTTHNAADRQSYIDNASTMQNLRNGFIAGAAALYVWNVIDGMVAKGKKHVVVLGDARLNMSPYLSPYGNGVTLSINF